MAEDILLNVTHYHRERGTEEKWKTAELGVAVLFFFLSDGRRGKGRKSGEEGSQFFSGKEKAQSEKKKKPIDASPW